jgi:hypothetical protein
VFLPFPLSDFPTPPGCRAPHACYLEVMNPITKSTQSQNQQTPQDAAEAHRSSGTGFVFSNHHFDSRTSNNMRQTNAQSTLVAPRYWKYLKLRITSQCAIVIEGIQAAVILVLGSLHRGDLL